MNQLRLSYTLLSTWLRGDKDGATKIYLRISKPGTPAMNRGQKFDRYVKKYVEEYKELPPELGGSKLQNPEPAREIEVQYNKMFSLKGEYDVLTSSEIIEVKCSEGKDSIDYSRDFQVDFYMLMADIAGMKIKRAVIYRYDPIRKEYDTSVVYFSQRRINRIRKIINERGPEIYQHLQSEGLL